MQNRALRILTRVFLVCLLSVPLTASAEAHSRFFVGNRAVVIRSNPYYWGYWGGWGSPFWGGYYGPYYYPYDNRGKIKIKDANKYDQVYLNGAYAGTVEKMKSIELNPGQYNVQVRQNGKELIDRNVYVVAGKTVEIHVNND